MEKTVTVYVDGSQHKKGNNFYLGWAVVVACNKTTSNTETDYEELSGSLHLTIRHGQQAQNSFEILAAIEGILYAYNRGVKPQNFIMFTDDERIGYAPSILHPENYNPKRFSVIELITNIVQQFYTEELLETILDYLRNGQIHKLKGHKGDVYQERANYLAKYASQQETSEYSAKDEKLGFTAWISKGIRKFNQAIDDFEYVQPAFVAYLTNEI